MALYWGVFAGAVWCKIPNFERKLSNLAQVYSPPLSLEKNWIHNGFDSLST
jgi:hypothetical protein